MEEGGVVEEVEQECMSMPSTTSHAVNGTTEGLGEIEGEGMGEQPPSKPRYVPKPPNRKSKITRRVKNSTYNWKMAREELGVTHHRQVICALNATTASTDNDTASTSTTINSPSKEEVKAENKKLKEQTYKLEREVGKAKRKVDCLQTQVKSLSGSLKTEKIKSWNAIEQLLKVTTIQQDTLLSTFHDKIVSIEEGHAISLRKLTRDNNNMTHNNQKSINQLKKRHAKEIELLSTEYLGDLTRMENDHNNTMVSSLVQIYRDGEM
jgi:hypothetical protein